MSAAYNVGQTVQRHKVGDLEEAQRCYRLGNAFRAQGRIDQAVAHYQSAVALQPNFVDAHNNLGLAYAAQGQMDQAIAHYEIALSFNPNYIKAHNNLGLAYVAQNRIDLAIAHYERALSINPDYAEAHNNLGLAYVMQDQIDPAIAHYERALSIKPGYALAHHNLGSALALQGQMGQAIAHYERALSLWPNNVAIHDSLLFMLNYASDIEPLTISAAHLDFAKRREVPLATSIPAYANDRSPERRLKIGYVSSDFRQHSVGYFIEPVLANHDHDRFEIFCYSNSPQDDEVTARLRSHADHWCSLVGLSDELTAQQIRADQIDILVDLNGHTGGNRLLVFARKPAPVQVTWLGYPNTTGLSAMDYRVTDGFADPPGMTEHLHSEKLVRLAECFCCYEPPRNAPEIPGLPARDKGYVTFGSFNNLAKITPEVMAVWANILHATPGSRLILKNPGLGSDSVRQRVRETFMALGVARERLELIGRDPSHGDHLERYRSIDIGLDSFPYNGATTTCEALWMGVPVVTLTGKAHAGRVGTSLLSNLGLTELIARTQEEYLAIAVRLAADPEHLRDLRKQLRARLAASSLTDGQRFTKNLEQAYHAMWKDWCIKNIPQNGSS